MKNRIYLNKGWLFCEEFNEEIVRNEFDESKMQQIRIPHTCKETPYHYFDEHIYQMISAYRKKIEAPTSWKGKKNNPYIRWCGAY